MSEAQKQALNLAHWRLAFCGAEVIRPKTVRQFNEAFGPCGFDPEAFYPCYGLAEATLFVSGATKRRASHARVWSASALTQGRAVPASNLGDERALVACGSVVDSDMRIVDPDTHLELQRGLVGEVWVCGESVAVGYWGNDALTQEIFHARMASSPMRGPFLRTGDLGFVDAEGELFVTGRLKDLIIVRGLNHVPTDIEETVEWAHPAFRKGGCAAFVADINDRERLIVAQEIEREQWQRADLATALEIVRENVTRVHGINVHDLVFLRHGALPRTTSGKVQRHLCAQRYIEGRLEEVDQRRSSVVSTHSPSIERAST